MIRSRRLSVHPVAEGPTGTTRAGSGIVGSPIWLRGVLGVAGYLAVGCVVVACGPSPAEQQTNTSGSRGTRAEEGTDPKGRGTDPKPQPPSAAEPSGGGQRTAHACPMHCEPGKTYAERVACPVCGMGLSSVDEIPFGVQLAPDRNRTPDRASGTFSVRVIEPTGKPTAASWKLHPRAYVAPRDLTSIQSVELPDGARSLDLSRSPSGLCVLAGRVSAGGRTDEPFLARFMNGPSVPDAGRGEPIKEDWDVVRTSGSLEFRVRCNGEPYPVGREVPVRISLQREGTPLASESVAHPDTDLVFISADLMTAVFGRRVADASDPMAAQARGLNNGHESDTIYGVTFPRSGVYRGFITLRHEGRELAFAFAIEARAGEADAGVHDHAHHGHAGDGSSAGGPPATRR